MKKTIVVANVICVGWLIAGMIMDQFSWAAVFVLALNIASAALNMSDE